MGKAILLDMDGVIRHLDLQNAEKYAKKIGVTFTELSAIIWDRRFIKDLICGKINREEWWICLQKSYDILADVNQEIIWQGVLGENYFNEELISFVRSLKDKATIAILTNCDSISKARIVKELERFDAFHEIFSSSDLGHAKPEIEIFLEVQKELKKQPNEIIFFDDSVDNVEAASIIGIHAFAYDTVENAKQRIYEFLGI
ncbi:MAG: HAD-IA family hydrolase [Candidatus Thorarchaeota archaeon]